MIKILHSGDLGKTTENVAGKLEVKLNNSGNVHFERTTAGLKGNVTIPDIPSVLNGASVSGNAITFTKTSGSPLTVQLPAPTVDVKLSSLEFTSAGKLKATLTDRSTVEVDFTAEVVVKAIEGANEAQKQRLVNALLPKLKTSLRGEEVKDFADRTTGYLLPAN